MASSMLPQFQCHICSSEINENARDHAINTHNCAVGVVDDFATSKSLNDFLMKLFSQFAILNDWKTCPLCKKTFDDMDLHVETEHGISEFLKTFASYCAASKENINMQSRDPDFDNLPTKIGCFICNTDLKCDIEHLTKVHKFFAETAEIVVDAKDHNDIRKKFSEHYDKILKKEPIWVFLQDWDNQFASKQKVLDAKFARLEEQTTRVAELNAISSQCLEKTKIVETVDKLNELAVDPEKKKKWTEIVEVVRKEIIDRKVVNSPNSDKKLVDASEKCKIMWLFKQVEKLLLEVLALMQMVMESTKFLEEIRECRSDLTKHTDLMEAWKQLIERIPTMENKMKITLAKVIRPLNHYIKLEKEWKELMLNWVESNEDFIKTIHWYYRLIKYSQETKKSLSF